MDNYQKFKIIAKVLGFFVFSLGLLVLIGWIFNISFFKSIFPLMVSMKVNTSICFVFIGLAIISFLWMKPENRFRNIIVKFCAFIVFFISGLTFYEYIAGYNLGIDQFLLKDSANAILTSSPGRMAFNTSINFIVVSIALFFINYRNTIYQKFVQGLSLVVFFSSLLSFVGYLYNAEPLLIGLKFSTAMALHTTLGFIFSGVAIIFCTTYGLMKVIAGKNTGSKIFRKLFFVIFVTPLLLGWLKLKATSLLIFSNEISVSLVAILNFSFSIIYIFIVCYFFNKKDEEKKELEKKASFSENRFISIFNFSRDALTTLEPPSWKFTSANKETLKLFKAKFESEFLSYELWKLSPEIQPDGSFSSEKAKKMIEKAMKDGVNLFEWIHKKIDGEEFLAEVLLSKVEQGDSSFLIANIRDISERKKESEIILQQNEEFKHMNKLMINRELKMIELKKELMDIKNKNV
ncbi:MAG: PAS domain S-box protein [Minisyncoccia bacterium]